MRFCTKCGAQCNDDVSFCGQCGATLNATQTNPAGQMPNYPQQGYPQPNYQQQQMYNSLNGNNYTRMGGWLLFFVIINIISLVTASINIIRDFVVITEELEYASREYTKVINLIIIGDIIAIASLTMILLYIIQIFSRKRLFLRFEQLARILSVTSVVFTSILPCIIVDVRYFESLFSQAISGIIGTCLGLFLMTLYYCKSIRVRTYMGSTEYIDKAFFKFKEPPVNYNSQQQFQSNQYNPNSRL